MTGTAGRLAVIPARGGSRRVPGKNVREMRGRPLLAYTVDAALGSGLFSRVVVSTDSEAIAEVARRCGAEVPFLRDPALADDVTPVSTATVDALARLDPLGTAFRHVAQLMPNCPLRTAEDVASSFAAFAAANAPAQISVTRFGWQNPWWAMERGPAGELQPLFPARTTERSQDLPELFCPTGAVWWAEAETLRREGTYHVPGRSGWEISWRHGVDIDTGDDWEAADALMAEREKGRVADAR